MSILRMLSVWCVLVIAGSHAMGQGGMPPANVVVDEVREESLIERRMVTGEIQSRKRSRVASQVEGVVVKMVVEAGDLVAKGDVIAQLDDVRAQIAFNRAMADLDFATGVMMQREAELEESRRDLERIEELERLGSSGVSQLDEARTLVVSREALFAQAKAELVSAKSDLHLAERELEDMKIVAPFDGVVEAKATEIGEWVGVGDEIATLVSIYSLEVLVDVPEIAYSSLYSQGHDGAAIELLIPAMEGLAADGRLFGRVEAVLPVADELSRQFRVRVGLDSVQSDVRKALRPGMSLSAWVPTGKSGEFVTVSKDAIVRTPTGEVVYFSRDGIAGVASVSRLFTHGDRVAIRNTGHGLADGMIVVVEGNERLMPGQPLMMQDRPTGVFGVDGEETESVGGDEAVEEIGGEG